MGRALKVYTAGGGGVVGGGVGGGYDKIRIQGVYYNLRTSIAAAKFIEENTGGGESNNGVIKWNSDNFNVERGITTTKHEN